MLDDGELVTRDRAAQELRRSTRTVNAAISDSCLKPVKAEPGRRDLYRFGELKAAVEERLGATADQTRNTSATAGLTAARQQLVEHKAAMAALERAKLEGELIEVAEVRTWMLSAFSVTRTRLLALPAKCAAKLGMAATLTERHNILKTEIHALLTELANSGDEVLARHQAALALAAQHEQEPDA
jgi:phage terminase Nu1 subunit (DNA packaging protein)